MACPGRIVMPMSRRAFLTAAGIAPAAMSASPPVSAGAAPRTYRAAVIGSTGRGNYGHGLDLAFQTIPNVTVVAVADPDAAGRERARARTRAPMAYADWAEMLAREKPDLVSIGPRWAVDRLEMVTAAARIGCHIYMEKPMAVSLDEADSILAVAAKHGIKIAVAHQVRLAPAILHLKNLVDGGMIGELLELRSRGKEDHRAGGEDLMVLGTHCMYLMRYFAGDALWCGARVTRAGRDVTTADRHDATEPLGPVAGDSIHASYAFAGGVQGHFASQKVKPGSGGRFEIALYGSKGAVMVHIDQDPAVFVLEDPLWSPGKSGAAWRALTGFPAADEASGLDATAASNRRIVLDLLRAIETGAESAVGGQEGRSALEMIMAVYASHLRGCRVPLPLEDRRHPLDPVSRSG